MSKAKRTIFNICDWTKVSSLILVCLVLFLMCSCTLFKDPEAENASASWISVTTTEKKQIVKMSIFSTTQDKEKSDTNEIRDIIAEKTGVKIVEVWETGQYFQNVIDGLLQSQKLTDFIYVSGRLDEFYDAGLLVAWDDYIEQYPNIKKLHTAEEWDSLRQSDGHIYSTNIPDAPVWSDAMPDENGLTNKAGFAVTICCKDPDAAFKFINDILSEDIETLRFWGIEGVDYLVSPTGDYYRTGEMTSRHSA